MVLSCGAKVLKYCLFAFNLVFFIAGIVCLGIGLYLIIDDHNIDRLIRATDSQNAAALADKPHAVHDLGVIMSIGGAIILVIAFLGCCGAVKEWRPLLVLYAICLMIILAIEIAAAIYAAVNRNTLESSIKKVMTDTLKYYEGEANGNTSSAVRLAWDKIMTDEKCCGVNETKINEFTNSSWFKNVFTVRYQKWAQNNTVAAKTQNASDYYPIACCPKVTVVVDPTLSPSNDQVCNAIDRSDQQGCYQKLKDTVESKLAIVIGVGAGVGLIQLIGIIFAFCLCRAITDEYVG